VLPSLDMAFERVHQMVDRVAELPALRTLRRRRFERRFQRALGHAFHGVYETFDAAAAAAPSSLPTSYDNQAAARMYVDRVQVDAHDYPALFWLQRALGEGAESVCDLGGSIGIIYYAFAPLLTLSLPVRWHVVEVAAAAALGAQIARERGATESLTFSSDPADVVRHPVLFASGALQYLPTTLAELLAQPYGVPRHVIVNTAPIHPTRAFFTLNNIGTACCPYRVASRAEFVAGVEGRGYRLVDEWQNVGKRLELPFERGLSLTHYSGFCFRSHS
jgi:putative methyltransferase (TIGR04325 family)